MKSEELVILLPCHSLEDFPVHSQGEEAEGLLAAWSVLWHPVLLATADSLPAWYRADAPPDNLANRLIVIPTASEILLWEDWPSRAELEGATLIRGLDDRRSMLSACLGMVDSPIEVDVELAADFMALGLSYLLVELLTRQMRYMSNVDEARLRKETMAAARAAVEGQNDLAREKLKSCFEVLVEARERFYPVECYLIDLTLADDWDMCGEPLHRELERPNIQNVLVDPSFLGGEASQSRDWSHATGWHAESFHRLKLAIEEKRLSVASCAAHARAAIADHETLHEAIDPKAFLDAGLPRPVVFGSRRFQLSPILPQILANWGFIGALHFALDDGVFPISPQAKFRWQGLDSSAIDAIGRVPLDAGAAENFLSFPTKMGESMDLDHVATVLFAHWPGHASEFYGDIQRASRYAPVLGRFVTLEDYFRTTDSPGELTRFRADQYRSPYLRQAADDAAASSHVATQARCARDGAETIANKALTMWGEVLGGQNPRADSAVANSSTHARAKAISRVLVGGDSGATGALVLNPQSFPHKAVVDISCLPSPPAAAGPVVTSQEFQGRKLAVVDLPGGGFAWVAAGGPRPSTEKKNKPSKPIVENNTLANEHLRVVIDQETGGIRSIHDGVQRNNRLSQQIAYRYPHALARPGDAWGDPDLDAVYTRMRAESVSISVNGPSVGEITTRGHLIGPDGGQFCLFAQRTRLARGMRRVEIDIELTECVMPGGFDPWQHYVACRFAWRDDLIDMERDVAMTAQPTTAKRIEAPRFIEVRNDRLRTAILTGGLPYHRLVEDGRLDTLLLVAGEGATHFRLGVAIEAPHPLHEALAIFAPPLAIEAAGASGQASHSSWLFHFDARNVVATAWAAIRDPDGTWGGVRVRVLETEGRAGRVALSAFRGFAAARQVNFLGEPLVELPVDSGRVMLDMAAYEWVEVEARWSVATSTG